MKPALLLVIPLCLAAVATAAPARIPVIYDTDIGDDIDDTWALTMLLKSPQFDIKLISTSCHKSTARSKIVAKLLTIAERTDIPIALGPGDAGTTRQDAWTRDLDMAAYKGTVHKDGVQAIIDTINGSPSPITVISVGPLQTMSTALTREPAIAAKASFVGMHGSVRKGYGGKSKPDAEYNVKRDAAACDRVLSAPWKTAAITPLDTCGIIHITGDRFKTLRDSEDPLVQALLENYRIWAKKKNVSDLDRSSTLFDTVAIYLADPGPRELAVLETLPIKVIGDGYTRIDESGARMSVATSWKDLDGYLDLLVKTLVSPTTRP